MAKDSFFLGCARWCFICFSFGAGCSIEDQDEFDVDDVVFRSCPGNLNAAINAIPNNDGKLCDYFTSTQKKCVSTDQVRPIVLNQSIPCSATLYLCTLNSNGTLSGCSAPGAEYDCETDPGKCWCSGVLECGFMINSSDCSCSVQCTHVGGLDGLVCSCTTPQYC